MKLPNFKRLIKQDFAKDFQDLIERLASSLNVGIDTLYNVLNNNVSLNDNIFCNVREIDIQVDSAGVPVQTGTDSFGRQIKTKVFNIDLPSTIQGLQVIKCENLTNTNSYPTSAIFLTYSQDGQSIFIKHVTGLQAGFIYRLRIIVWG